MKRPRFPTPRRNDGTPHYHALGATMPDHYIGILGLVNFVLILLIFLHEFNIIK